MVWTFRYTRRFGAPRALFGVLQEGADSEGTWYSDDSEAATADAIARAQRDGVRAWLADDADGGRRWTYATIWVQPSAPTRVIVWTDRGRHRLQHFDTEAAATAELERMEHALADAGWTRVDQLDTGRGYVLVSREEA